MNNIHEYAKSFQLNIKLDTKKEKLLLNKLNNPQNHIPHLIHVTGTNGKGSVCAFLETMLISSGASVGKYSSPELIEKNEIIRLNGNNIETDELNRLIEQCRDACIQIKHETGEDVSQFEILTACAFLYFAQTKPDYVIMEVGMGGAGDATNVCDNTYMSIITKISLDHCEYLGNTKREIARVKCDIIKNNTVVITSESNKDVHDIIEDTAHSKNSEVIYADELKSNGFFQIYEKVMFEGEEITLSLGGINQTENASIAICAAQKLNIPSNHIKYGLEHTKHPGRLEKLSDNFYFDGAHNADGAIYLKKNIQRYFKGKNIVYITAMMKDKDISAMISTLNFENAIFKFVQANVVGRAATADHMLKIANENKNVCAKAYLDVNDAIFEAKEFIKTNGGVIIACGSLYFYKDITKGKMSTLTRLCPLLNKQ